jgi:HAD superfamily hydrolase (TIGR01509 family)
MLIIFDLDGVLITSRELHYHTLNEALASFDTKYVISLDEHLATYDGLSTTAKLNLLSETKNLPSHLHDAVWNKKQERTVEALSKLPVNHTLIDIFKRIKELGISIAVASNSIRESLKTSLLSIGVMRYVDYYVSNQDVKRSKPFPEMYWKCMTELNEVPSNTIIVEDSHIGRQGAIDSGANLLAVSCPQDVTWDLIHSKILEVQLSKQHTKLPWKSNTMNVLIPMAGAGSRFAEQGYVFPKPLIEVNGRAMIDVVVDNLNIEANYIFIVQREHYERFNLKYMLNMIAPNCTIVQTDGLTEGAACTTLLAKEFINTDAPLVIANSDQFIEWNSNECMYAFTADAIDGGILTFDAVHPKWSYAKLDDTGFVSEVAEKKPISNHATCGVYYWKHGSDYVKYAEQMIEKNVRTNNEFYVCPVFNEAIQDGKKIKIKQINRMWGIGTPEDLNFFIDNFAKL